MCKVLEINHSTYRKSINHKASKRDIFTHKLDCAIRMIHLESRGIYGAPKIHNLLIKQAEFAKTSLKLVQKRMSKMCIKSIVTKKFRPVCKSSKVEEKENIMNQDFSTTEPNQKFCTDITYVYTKQDGWTYLAEVIDLYSRKIVGYSYSKTMTAEMAVEALKRAVEHLKDTTGIIVQTDLGTQYTSDLFEKFLLSHKMIHSYSHKHYPYDNSPIESFHAILKKEEVRPDNIYLSYDTAKIKLFEFIEGWYNNKRIHSSINYKTPNEVYYEKLVA